MSNRVLRMQDADGRGPYKPGFSRVWCDTFGPPPPPTWMEEFPWVRRRMNEEDAHYGSAVRSVEQLRKWFTPTELFRLHLLGYRLVAMEADRILAESKNQLVFMRRKPLNTDIEFIDIEPTSSGSALQINHGNQVRITHRVGAGESCDPGVTRAATDGFAEAK